MGQLIIVRHAQASFGTDDYDRLSELGFQQARWVGEALREQGLEADRFAMGAMRRHRETMESLLVGMGVEREVEVLPGLDEYDGGAVAEAFRAAREAEGAPLGAIDPTDRRAHFRMLREALTAWRRGELDAFGTGVYETYAAFEERVEAARAALCDPARGETVLAVSSGGPISQIIARTLEASHRAAIELNLQARNTGISRFMFSRSGGFFLSSFNAVPHLERPDRASALTYA